jgi:hypothetical protein
VKYLIGEFPIQGSKTPAELRLMGSLKRSSRGLISIIGAKALYMNITDELLSFRHPLSCFWWVYMLFITAIPREINIDTS